MLGRSFWVVAAGLLMLLADANLPTPLYAVYRQLYGFSGTVLTLIFATYSMVLIVSLLMFGQLSDRIGRRRVISGGLFAAGVALVLYVLADGTGWLFAARAVQGLAVGAVTGTATAALVELEPDGDRTRAARVATVAQAGGASAAPVLAGTLAQWLPAPRVLCYLVGLVPTILLGFAMLRVPDVARLGGVWRPQLPSVPAGSRARFVASALSATAAWAVGGLYFSVIPTYAATLLGTHNLALLGAIVALLLATACAAQLISIRTRPSPATGQAAGLSLLVAGLAALVVAFPARSLILLLVAALLSGAGIGLALVGAQTDINDLAPAERRGEVTAAFMICFYGGITVAAIAVGLISDALSLFLAVAIVVAAIGATALPTSWWHWRRRLRDAEPSVQR